MTIHEIRVGYIEKDIKGKEIAHEVQRTIGVPGLEKVKTARVYRIEAEKLVIFRYCDRLGNPTQEYPLNPNGSLNAIAGITDPTGRILGLMPHPERFIRLTQHPNWRRMQDLEPQGLPIFEKMVSYAAQM